MLTWDDSDVDTRWCWDKTMLTQDDVNTRWCCHEMMLTQGSVDNKMMLTLTEDGVDTRQCCHEVILTQDDADTRHCWHETQDDIDTRWCWHKMVMAPYDIEQGNASNKWCQQKTASAVASYIYDVTVSKLYLIPYFPRYFPCFACQGCADHRPVHAWFLEIDSVCGMCVCEVAVSYNLLSYLFCI